MNRLPPDDDDAPPGNPPSEPKFTSLSDPAVAWTNKGQMKAVFAYGTNHLIDTKEAANQSPGQIPCSARHVG
jgi:hypothetical protein